MSRLFSFLRTWLYTAPWAAFCIVVFGCHSLVESLFGAPASRLHRVAAWWSRLFISGSGVKVEVSGAENVPRNGGMVLVSNHLSTMDIPLLTAHLPVPFRFLAKTSLFRTPFIGWHLHRAGHIRVVRESKTAAVRAVEKARELVERGAAVLVFAEGSRSVEGLQRFKAGAAHIAIRAGAPVIPIALIGTDQLMPKKTLRYYPATVGLRIGLPIATSGLERRDNGALTETLQSRIAELISEGAVAGG